MNDRAAPARRRDVFLLDERTVQLGVGHGALRIIGPAQQTVTRLQEYQVAPSAPRAPDQAIRVRARRQLAAVLIEGLPRPGVMVAEQLTRLELGTLLLCDERPVDRADVTQGYAAAAVGHPRAAAVRRICLQRSPEARVAVRVARPSQNLQTTENSRPEENPQAAPGVRPLPQEPVDLHVIFAERAVAPARLAAAAALAERVLPVVRHDDHWAIGPMLSRERGPCAQCLLLHGSEEDPHWETAQTALAAAGEQMPTQQTPAQQTPGQQRPAQQTPGQQTPAQQTPVHQTPWTLTRGEAQESAAVVASLVTREVQLAVDGLFLPQTTSRVIELCAATGELDLVPVTPHPECICRLSTAALR